MKAAFREYWWLWLGGLALGLGLGLSGRSGEYVSEGTYIVRPSATNSDEIIRATRGLTDGSKVEATYSYIIESDRVYDRARLRVETGGAQGGAVSVDASTIPGADMVTISVRSRDPGLAHDMAVAVGEEAADYVGEFDDIYSLVPLDEPTLPVVREPLGLWRASLAPILVLAGVGAVIVIDRRFGRYWRLSTVSENWGDVGTNDPEYTMIRLREEVSRTDVSGVPFRFALVRIGRSASDGHARAIRGRHIVRVISPTLRDHDHIGAYKRFEAYEVAAILPGLSEDEMGELTAEWASILHELPGQRGPRQATAAILDCRYEHGSFIGGSLAAVVVAQNLAR